MQIMDIPGSSLSSFPRINKIQFPSGELPRPAVIGLSGNCGTYINNASAIKEILASVLNIQDNLKSTLTDIEASQEDSDVENLEDSSSGGFTEESDSDSDHFPLSTRVQDMLFKRSSVSQDILETESSIALETDPVTCQMQVSITNALKPALEFLPFLKPDSCPEAVLQKRDINTQVKFPDTQKEGRRFSSPNIYHNFTLSETTINCTSGNLALPISANVSDSAACNRQDEKLCQRSQSYSSVLKALDTSFTAKTEMCPSTENAFEPTVLLENENAHFFVADMFISVVENLKSSLQTMYYQQWIADIQGFYPTWFNNHTESCVSRQKRLSESAVSVDSGYEGLVAMQQNFLTHNEHNSKFCCEWQNFKDTPTDEHDFEQCAFWHNSPMTALVEREFKHGALWQNSPSDPSKESDSRYGALWQNSPSDPSKESDSRYGALWQNSPRDPSDENASKQRALWVNSPTNDLLGAHSEYCLETTCSTAEDGAKMCLNSEEHSDSDEFVIIEMDDNKYHMGEVTELSIKTKRDNPAPGSNSAEQTVKKLYRAFRQQWVQHEENLHSATIILNVEKEDIMAEEFESSVRLAEEIRKFRMREAEEWTPPRFQIINVIHPSPKRDVIVASQNYMCAGCGTKVEPRYINRLRYCEYLGKYFCDCCHSNSLTFIPGQIL
ncbi:hypothetical protein GDO86_004213 [Hymenochirus boettgeri]|uniref:Rubicon PI3K-binding domain-containing protein n=1 Tax=Hymenochirus boettgeri TaxID=247094 RepID=A0A8T2K6Y3_9PIPI|nr:hypothetical protein GDO86_004213 [Hymenochirus boettgeri]